MTWTGLRWPRRWTRSVACCSTAGFHQRSKWITWFAAGRLSPRAAGPQRDDEQRRAVHAVEAGEQLVARPRRETAVEEADVPPEPRPEMGREAPEARVLGEDERLVVRGDVGQQLDEPLELPGAPLERPAGGDDELGVVAELLQLAEHREHGAAAVEPALVLLDLRQPAVDDRLVEARLLDRQVAADLGDRDRRELQVDLGRVLRPAEDERPDERAQALEGMGVAPHLDRAREAPLERLARPEQPWVDQLHDRPELPEVVLDRRARERERPVAGNAPQGAVALRPGVLHVLRLVQEQAVPRDRREEVGVAGRDVVGRDDDVVARRRGEERRAAEPRRPVVDVDAQAGREPGDLAPPLLRRRSSGRRRAWGRSRGAPVAPRRARDRLHRLAEPHVVGEDPADPEVA